MSDRPIEPDVIEAPDGVTFGTRGLALVVEDYTPGSAIHSNIDALRQQVQVLLDNTQLWDLQSPTDYREAKKTRTDIRKVRKAINDRFSEIRDAYTQPVEDFRAEIKTLTDPLDEADATFRDAIRAYEERRKQKRRAVLAEQYEDMAGILAERVPFDTFLDIRGERAKNGDLLWLRSSTLEPTAVESMGRVLKEMLGEWELLGTVAGSPEDADRLRSYYLQTLDVKTAIEMYQMVKANERALKAEREAEEAWRKEHESSLVAPEGSKRSDTWHVTAEGWFEGTHESMDSLGEQLAALGFADVHIEVTNDGR